MMKKRILALWAALFLLLQCAAPWGRAAERSFDPFFLL